MNEKRERDRRHEKMKEECMRGFTVVSICVKCGAAINVLRTSQGERKGRERDKAKATTRLFFSILGYFLWKVFFSNYL